MNPSPKLKAFVFDAYGTVFDVHSVADLAEQFFPGQGKSLSQLWRAKQIEYMYLRTLMGRYIPHNENTESALVYACKALGLECDAARRAKLMQAYLRLTPYPEAVGALGALAAHKRAILSVGTKPMLTEMVAHAGMTQHFDKLISVDAVKVYKPHPATYQLVLDELGVARPEVGFVTSNYFDVAGAKAFGFTVFWINRNNALPDELGLLPDHVLTDLAGLKQFA
ncbi:haloacid dehalogenase type II [Ramlibacter sp.]|uniref:haloacid dehalogenase type II n=1 Tax=Ramlibacter sp. TaxID=1917967 RepID=UPI002FC7F993